MWKCFYQIVPYSSEGTVSVCTFYLTELCNQNEREIVSLFLSDTLALLPQAVDSIELKAKFNVVRIAMSTFVCN